MIIPTYFPASDEVVVYGCNIETYSNDAFLAFPIDVIGDEYYAVSHYPSTYECEFMVVGVTDDTTITIQLGEHSAIEVYWDGRYYYKDDTFTVTVDRFDTLQVGALSMRAKGNIPALLIFILIKNKFLIIY